MGKCCPQDMKPGMRGWTLVITQILTNSRQVKKKDLGFGGFAGGNEPYYPVKKKRKYKWKEKSECRFFSLWSRQTCTLLGEGGANKTKKEHTSERKYKFYGKFRTYSEVRALEEDTAATRKPLIMEIRDVPHLALIDHLHPDVNHRISGYQFLLAAGDSPNTLPINAP